MVVLISTMPPALKAPPPREWNVVLKRGERYLRYSGRALSFSQVATVLLKMFELIIVMLPSEIVPLGRPVSGRASGWLWGMPLPPPGFRFAS